MEKNRFRDHKIKNLARKLIISISQNDKKESQIERLLDFANSIKIEPDLSKIVKIEDLNNLKLELKIQISDMQSTILKWLIPFLTAQIASILGIIIMLIKLINKN